MSLRNRLVPLLATLALIGCHGTRPSPPPAPAPPVKLKIGLALGGGAAKGFAHIGVIKMLEASGMDAFALQQTAVDLDETKIRDVRLFSGGLVQGQALQDYVNQQVHQRPIEFLGKPFAAVATELETGTRATFVRGDTGQAVRASASVPGVFEPVAIGGKHYVDGGVVSPVPVDAARQLGADFVIAVDISNKASGRNPDGMVNIVGQAIVIMGQRLGEQELARADVVIRPHVADIGATAFAQKNAAIVEGEKAALAAISAIRARLAQRQAAAPAAAAAQPPAH